MQVRVLSTRCLNEANVEIWDTEKFALRQTDFIAIEYLPFDLDKVYEVLLFTSQNAVRSVLQHPNVSGLKDKPVLCVGIKTKTLLEANGWEVLRWSHYAEELAKIIRREYAQKRITFFNGNLRRDTLPDLFREKDVIFNEFEVYRTVLTPYRIEQKQDAVLFFSPSGIESFLKVNKLTDEVCFCIGTTTAAALKGVSEKIVTASCPTVEATIQACIGYYK